ncbi:hypothetical protein WOLCODRAFT_166193 [Wolfiporia cocos MD-104 SS10]|uniref:CST complex subunit STN1 n=1 Tax=Wolfiporia cocos (strain MD-104) TaxID=742152 RepID=A0A2H3J978_WOLCO|nr:hypothetical protein WOLCODRAFT_166193 [Wolfiporia cocos MD-104 SS10]
MSLTTTETTKRAGGTSFSLPNKRRRNIGQSATYDASRASPTVIDVSASKGAAHTTNNAAASSDAITASAQPNPSEIWKWTLTRDAIASCFVRDVLEMRESDVKGAEFFWLGRVPCRTVRLVGLLIGVQVHEKRTIYSLDDGTGVLDCIYRYLPQQSNCSPTKSRPHSNNKPYSTSHSRTSTSAPPSAASSTSASSYKRLKPHASHSIGSNGTTVPPKPVADVGASVKIVGRVVQRRDGRVLLLDEIEVCGSMNDEPKHWLAVMDLHRTYYDATELGPFSVPLIATCQSSIVPVHRTSPSKDKGKARATSNDVAISPEETASSPSHMEPPIPSAHSTQTDTSPSDTTSGARERDKQFPPRLRHPSRLHTSDLTLNTFRIYMKHYMDHAPSLHRPRSRSSSPSRSLSPSPSSQGSLPSRTLRMRSSAHGCPLRAEDTTQIQSKQTPRASRSRVPEDPNRTPRASKRCDNPAGSISISLHLAPHLKRGNASEAEDNFETKLEGRDQQRGFTLSHLRRVPELALLAGRIVDAEGRRREREARKAKARGEDKDKAVATNMRNPSLREPRHIKMKRLFRRAVRMLYDDGSIVLWEGRVMPLPPACSTQSDVLWKANSSSMTASSASASAASSSTLQTEDDEDVLSDPQPDEEAYFPVSVPFLAGVVEGAIKRYMEHAASRPRWLREKDERGTAFPPPGPPPGPKLDVLLKQLRADVRWANISEFAVKEALEWARAAGRIWCVGDDRWELCG